MKKYNHLVGMMLLMCMIFTLPNQVYASDIGENSIDMALEPRNTNIKYSTISLSLSGNIAYCSASVTGYSSNTNRVSIYLYLQKYSNGWVNVTSWSDSVSKYTLTMNKSATISRGRYRLKASYYAENENIVKYSSEKVY